MKFTQDIHGINILKVIVQITYHINIIVNE